MITLSLGQIADIMGGTLNSLADPTTLVTGTVEFDSRKVTAGGLFLCLVGERANGHDYAVAAYGEGKGVAAVVATRPVDVPAIMLTPQGRSESNATALENDADGSTAAQLDALGKLANYVVSTLVAAGSLTVVGITGSSGKTSTKDLTAAVLSTAGEIVAPPGSFNNELGFPWTALRATETTRFLVLEVSARGVGHIAQLCTIVAPQIGVELNVGHAHLGEFGSRDAITQAKGELVEALPDANNGGVALLNYDDPRVLSMRSRTNARVVTYGRNPAADISASEITLDHLSRPSFTAHVDAQSYPVTLAVSGAHNVANSLAVIGVAEACGIDIADAVLALGNATIVSGKRMEIHHTDSHITVINDSYNANPDSMRAALAALVNMGDSDEAVDHPHRTWAILGYMGELGEDSLLQHTALAEDIAQRGISELVTVGSQPEVLALTAAAREMGVSARNVDNKDEASQLVREEVQPYDVVLVKASQSVGLWTIAENLINASTDAPE